ncbi:MAG: ABC transporter substrate-binding protein, partial [bacterium]
MPRIANAAVNLGWVRATTALLALLLAVLWPTVSPAGPATGETAVILQGADIVTLEPYFSSSLPDQNAIIHIFETMTRHTDDLRLVPWLAESWRLRDARTWEFKLVPGRRFQNGEPLNAEAMRFSLMR